MPGSGERDAKPGPTEERTTERRMVTASAVMQTAAEAPRPESLHEDFLFHLYRGSELLQDNRVHEAKEELEQAFALQPRDPKSQDLLAVVYFRIGLYPRAIQIFRQLDRDNPREPSIKLNLALCYLKTGQAPAARTELEEVVRLHPAHKRAWGYLGLAYERTGDLDKAQGAFQHAGHAQMAARIGERLSQNAPGAAADADVRGAAARAFEELDAGDLDFSLAESVTGSNAVGDWRAIEPGAVAQPPSSHTPHSHGGWTVPPSAEAVASVHAEAAVSRAIPTEPPPASVTSGPHATSGTQGSPAPLAQLERSLRLVFPQSAGVLMHPSGVALVRTTAREPERPFAARLESIRVQAGSVATEILARHAGGKSSSEPLGGVASPLVRITGAGDVVLGPRPSHGLVAFTISEESVAVREDVLLGFEAGPIACESSKLALGDGETAHVVALAAFHRSGVVLLELLEPMQAIAVTEERPLLVRRDALLGWTGSIVPRALPASEVPAGQRGMLRLAGAGTALLSSR